MTRNAQGGTDMPRSWRGPSPHFKLTEISRTTGANAVARAAHHHAALMTLPGGEFTRDHRNQAGRIKRSGIMLPDDAPSWAKLTYGEPAFRAELFQAALTLFQDDAVTLFVDDAGLARCRPSAGERTAWACLSERLWTDIEQAETVMNRQPRRAQLARQINAALPRTVTLAAQTDIVRGFAQEAFTCRGIVVDWTIHDRSDGNPNVFMMLPTRLLGDDTWGQKHRHLNHRSELLALRNTWGRIVNLVLDREGSRERLDMRSHKDQGIRVEPESHDRRIAANAERAGVTPVEKRRSEEVRQRNQALLRENPEHIIMMVQAGRTSFTKSELLAALAYRLDLTPETLPPEMAAKVTDSPDLMPTGEKTEDGKALFATRAKVEAGP